MPHEPIKQDWIEQARDIFRFHRSKLLSNNKWTITLTAKALKRAVGSVGEDIMIARWLRTHENHLLKCDTRTEALEFIREKKKSMDLEADD
jgi:hypothetical protein